MIYDVYYLIGLCEMLKSIHNGRINHKRDNLIQALMFYIFAKNNDYPINDVLIEECVEKSLAIIRKEMKH